jgi:hypothetical protein
MGHGIRRNGFVQDPESADDFGIGIRKQEIGNMLSVRKVLEHGHAVIADRGQIEALGADITDMLFQLDELGFAERSPVGRTEKYEQCPFRAKDTFQVLQSTVLVRRLKRRHGRTDLRAGFDGLLRPGHRAGREEDQRRQQARAEACPRLRLEAIVNPAAQRSRHSMFRSHIPTALLSGFQIHRP